MRCVKEMVASCEDPFDAEIYFRIQKQIGLDPYVRDDAIGFRIVADDRAEYLNEWAAAGDPCGRERAAYAAKKWAARPPGQRLVFLG